MSIRLWPLNFPTATSLRPQLSPIVSPSPRVGSPAVGPPARPQPAWLGAPGRPPPPLRRGPGHGSPRSAHRRRAVPQLGSHHDTHRRVDRVALAHASRPQRAARQPDLLSVDLGERPRLVGDQRHDQGRTWEDGRGIVHHARIAALRLHHADGSARARSRRPVRLAARARASEDAIPVVATSASAANATASSRSRPRCPPRRTVDGLDDVQGVADGVAQRLRHVASRRRARGGRSRGRAQGTPARAPRPARWSS